jgi:hypothetical protein
LKKGPAKTADQALTAEADWQNAELPVARARTAAGTGPASNVATFSENNNNSAANENSAPPAPTTAELLFGSALAFESGNIRAAPPVSDCIVSQSHQGCSLTHQDPLI